MESCIPHRRAWQAHHMHHSLPQPLGLKAGCSSAALVQIVAAQADPGEPVLTRLAAQHVASFALAARPHHRVPAVAKRAHIDFLCWWHSAEGCKNQQNVSRWSDWHLAGFARWKLLPGAGCIAKERVCRECGLQSRGLCFRICSIYGHTSISEGHHACLQWSHLQLFNHTALLTSMLPELHSTATP